MLLGAREIVDVVGAVALGSSLSEGSPSAAREAARHDGRSGGAEARTPAEVSAGRRSVATGGPRRRRAPECRPAHNRACPPRGGAGAAAGAPAVACRFDAAADRLRRGGVAPAQAPSTAGRAATEGAARSDRRITPALRAPGRAVHDRVGVRHHRPRCLQQLLLVGLRPQDDQSPHGGRAASSRRAASRTSGGARASSRAPASARRSAPPLSFGHTISAPFSAMPAARLTPASAALELCAANAASARSSSARAAWIHSSGERRLSQCSCRARIRFSTRHGASWRTVCSLPS